ncbi:MAG: flagellar filament capping protein FliD, partial [Nitrospirota bacterium]|nr:flagellar filament capping protein FliD [Nitrospirota bacterium]
SLFSNATKTGDTPVTAQITAAAGSTVNDIVNALNSEFATKKMDVSASNNNGTLQIRTTNYGDDYKVQVLSNVPDAADQSGIGTTVLETQGVDIVGTLNGFTAKGVGAVLTSTSGFGDKGLSIKAEVSTTGSFGTITVSSGIADRMEILLEAAVNTTSGTIKVRQDGIIDSVEDLDDDIARKAATVALFEQRTLEKFQRLEVLLGSLQTQSQALGSALLGLQNLSTFISNR